MADDTRGKSGVMKDQQNPGMSTTEGIEGQGMGAIGGRIRAAVKTIGYRAVRKRVSKHSGPGGPVGFCLRPNAGSGNRDKIKCNVLIYARRGVKREQVAKKNGTSFERLGVGGNAEKKLSDSKRPKNCDGSERKGPEEGSCACLEWRRGGRC